MKIDIGMTAAKCVAIAADLSHLLADRYTLDLKNHNYHWNVTGPQFATLHVLHQF